ncbi:chaperonin GroEL [Angomonas deanei]|nr:chaperonin GroEL [Angomonas deanei]|eukprot:EPY35871.1 chaperonin GroEL [Angomonas deanei]
MSGPKGLSMAYCHTCKVTLCTSLVVPGFCSMIPFFYFHLLVYRHYSLMCDGILPVTILSYPPTIIFFSVVLFHSYYSIMFRSVVRRQAKDIAFGESARARMQKGVTRAVAAVATTMGPKGRNVIIEQQYGSPRVTKDGVSVARAIDFEDHFENMGAQLLKQVCNQTNDLAGDGTTTAAVLVDSIFGEGLKCIARGTNPIDMKRGMDVAVQYVQTSILKQARQVNDHSQIVRVATISANGDTTVGEMIGQAMEKVGRDGVITTKEGNTTETELEVVEGMKIDRGFSSPYFVTDPKAQKVELENAYVLVHSKKISSIHTLLPALNFVVQQNRPLLIIADDVESEALTTLILNKLQGKLKVCCVKAPGFGDTKEGMLLDISIFTGAKLLGAEGSSVDLDADNFDHTILGNVKKVTVSKDEAVILNGGGDAAAVQSQVELLRELAKNEPTQYNREKLQERLAKLSGGVAVIKVGGASEVEVGEKKDRVIDAVCATRAAVQEGIVPGGGVALLRASVELEKVANNETLTRDQRTGVQIIRNAIRLPAMRIAANAGKEGAVVVEKILEQTDAAVGYDAATDRYVNMFDAGIIDPARVVSVALNDASSVASLMMTAEAAVVQSAPEKKEKDAKKKSADDVEEEEEDVFNGSGLY